MAILLTTGNICMYRLNFVRFNDYNENTYSYTQWRFYRGLTGLLARNNVYSRIKHSLSWGLNVTL